jgi:hypothetical protein
LGACCFIWAWKTELPETGWVEKAKLNPDDYAQIYLESFFFIVTTVTTVGYGNISATNFVETGANIVFLVSGSFSFINK